MGCCEHKKEEKTLTSQELIEMEHHYGAHNYHPLEVVISRAEGVWVWDPEGRRYLDCLSAYSAVNQGHRHPAIIKALKEQADVLTLTSRAFFNDRLPLFAKKLSEYTGKEMILPMNTGAEAVETAIKLSRRWGYEVKKVEKDRAEIIVMRENFHGRTTTIVGFSTDPSAYTNYGPFTPGFVPVDFDDPDAVEQAITKNTVAVLVEPIQGEAGVRVPRDGYLRKLREICTKHRVLLVADEIQTGLGRTGKKFCYMHDNIIPDVIIMGKALGGGVFPVSAIAANKDIMGVFTPGTHGSTFGGNPLACAVAMAALDVIENERLAERSAEMGAYFMGKLKELQTRSKKIKEVRGKGLLIGVVMDKEVLSAAGEKARTYTTVLKNRGILAKETHDWIIRFAPPLVIEKEEIDWAMEIIAEVLA